MELQVEAHRPEWLHVMPNLRLDHAWLGWLQDALGRRGLDAVAQPAFKDMDQGHAPPLVSCALKRAAGTVSCVNTGVRR